MALFFFFGGGGDPLFTTEEAAVSRQAINFCNSQQVVHNNISLFLGQLVRLIGLINMVFHLSSRYLTLKLNFVRKNSKGAALSFH